MTFKKTLLATLVGASLSLPMAAIAQDVTGDGKDVTLRVAYDADPVSLDIHEQLSGGMLQLSHLVFDPLVRWMLDPDVIVADEPTTALDVTIQAEIMELLLELCEKHNVALILITHDLGVVSQVTQRTLVMYAGRVIEQGPTREIINDAQHPYTQGLINALPQMATPGQRLNQIPGSMPSLANTPPGCAFHPRCSFSVDANGERRRDCREVIPEFVRSGNCDVACHMVRELVETRPAEHDASEQREAP